MNKTEEQKKKKKCKHIWQAVGNWRAEILLIGEMLEYPVRCRRCGLKATEMYEYRGRRDEDNNAL
jgi:C4-type Zn-finger protein